MRYTLLVASLLLSLLSCEAQKRAEQANQTTAAMNSWMGHHKSELYKAWGPPTRVTDDGNGGEILIYEQAVVTGQLPGRVFSNGVYVAPTQTGYNWRRMFYVNAEGKVYYWKTEG